MDAMNDLKRLAGIKEDVAEMYELHEYLVGNSRPFVSEGTSGYILEELYDLLNKDDWVKLEIHPKK